MARTIQTIYNTIKTAIAADPTLSTLNTTSAVGFINLIAYTIASSQAVEEQLNDQFVNQVENVVNILPPATGAWIQEQAFLFQYSSSFPQILQFSTASYTPYYPTVNLQYRIITNCSVSSNSNAFVKVKVAKGTTASVPQALATTELQAFQYYMNQLKPAGIAYFCTSDQADRLFAKFTVNYIGSYNGTISASLLAAYNNYLQNIDFGGTIKYVDILLALRQVPGVLDITCSSMIARPNSTPFGSGNIMVVASTVQNIEYLTASGYIIPEDTTGQDFLSQLILLPQ